MVLLLPLLRLTLAELGWALSQYSTDPDIRTGALWAIINQCWVDPKTSSRRRPREILDKLKALGVEERLQGMLQDANLDVRERVRDALKVLSGV